MWILFALQLAEASCLCRHRYMGCHRRKSREFAGPWRWPKPETSGDGRERGAWLRKGFCFYRRKQVMCWIVFVEKSQYQHICFYHMYIISVVLDLNLNCLCKFLMGSLRADTKISEVQLARQMFFRAAENYVDARASQRDMLSWNSPEATRTPWKWMGFRGFASFYWLTEPMVSETASRLNLKLFQKSLVWK